MTEKTLVSPLLSLSQASFGTEETKQFGGVRVFCDLVQCMEACMHGHVCVEQTGYVSSILLSCGWYM